MTEKNSSIPIFANYQQAENHVFDTEGSQAVCYYEKGRILTAYFHYVFHETGGGFVFEDVGTYQDERIVRESYLYKRSDSHLMN